MALNGAELSATDLFMRLAGKFRSLGREDRVAIKAGRVITGLGVGERVLDNRVVVIEDGLIATISADWPADLGADVERIEAPNATLMPGLIEGHCHLSGEWARDPHATHLEPFPETKALRALIDSWANLNAGFTTQVSMGHGHPNHVGAVRAIIDEQDLPGPRIYQCGWALSQTAGHGHVREWNYDVVADLQLRSAFGDGPYQLRAMVRENVGRGADFTKIFSGEGGYTAPDYILRRTDFTDEEIQAITDESHRLGLRVASHCMSLEHAVHAARNGVDRIEHGPIQYEPDFVPMLKETGAAWCPTLSQLNWALIEKEKRGLAPAMVAKIENAVVARCRMILEALAAGVTVGFGTDIRMRPKSGHNALELQVMVNNGINPIDALTIATHGAARLIGAEAFLGAVEVGKFADLILVDGDPSRDVTLLTDHKRVSRVFKSGRTARLAPL